MHDPDTAALLLVQQFLQEQGYHEALAALERQCGLLYDESKYERGSELLEMVYARLEQQQAADEEGTEAAQRKLEEQALLQGGTDDYPCSLATTVAGAHTASITCVRLWPGRDAVLTGSGDGSVKLVELAGRVVWSTQAGSGGVLSLQLQPPQAASGSSAGGAAAASPSAAAGSLLATSSMDGSVSVLDAATGQLLCQAKPHAKYVVRAAWSPCGSCLATGSYDQSAALLKLQAGAGGGTGAGAGAADAAAPAAGGQLELVPIKQALYASQVQDVAFAADGATCFVAVRGTNYLHRLHGVTGQELPPRNLNTAGDDHVSFSVMRLALSPCGRYLLAATDGPRVLMLRAADCSVVRTVFGLPDDKFHVPSLAWHKDGRHAFVGAPGAVVLVVHMGTCKVVARLAGHKINVRDLDYDVRTNRLATASFDKTVNIYNA